MVRYLLLAILAMALAGCATITYPPPPETMTGVYHEVQKNETLWAISKAYSVRLKRIVGTNKIPDADELEVGQLIFIPDRNKTIDIDLEAISPGLEPFIWPVRGEIISHFGSLKNASKNRGIDIRAPYGKDIVVSRSGKVTYCTDFMKGYGRTIIVEHEDGFQTVYAYNAENLVNVGNFVKQGQVIAKVGKGGRAKVSSLHFEIREKHKPKNPFYYLP